MKMKQPAYLFLLAGLTIIAGSCSKNFVTLNPEGQVNEGNFFKTVSDFQEALVGCYTPLRTAANDPDAVRLGVGTTVEEAEKMLILKTLEATSNNKTRAAEILGISLKTLHNKLKEYGNAAAESLAGKEETLDSQG